VNDAAPGLGETPRALLGLLKRRGPATLVELESAAGLARESLRDHLRSLAAAGLVERAGVRRGGRGRPAVLYRLSTRADRLFPERGAELLGELVSYLLAGGHGAALEAFFEARARDKRARLEARLAGLEGAARVRALAAALDAEGFVAEAEVTRDGRARLRLCHCPVRGLVERSQLPCRAELALVGELLGTPLRRESFMPEGGATCTYSFPVPDAAQPSPGGAPRLPTALNGAT